MTSLSVPAQIFDVPLTVIVGWWKIWPSSSRSGTMWPFPCCLVQMPQAKWWPCFEGVHMPNATGQSQGSHEMAYWEIQGPCSWPQWSGNSPYQWSRHYSQCYQSSPVKASSSSTTTLLEPDHLPELEDLDITGSHIHQVALRIQGSAGPGGCDSTHWKDITLQYGSSSQHFWDCIAELTCYMANSIIDWVPLRALLANRLIALDKSPGIRPMGVRETLRWIIGKTISSHTGRCWICMWLSSSFAGVRCGVEGAIHAVSDLFNSNDYGVLTMDATNAFKSINRISLIWNIFVLWPRASRFIFNTYRGWSPLIERGSTITIFSREGVVQRDPLSMYAYSVATIPLIQELNYPFLWRQIWFANDSSVI